MHIGHYKPAMKVAPQKKRMESPFISRKGVSPCSARLTLFSKDLCPLPLLFLWETPDYDCFPTPPPSPLCLRQAHTEAPLNCAMFIIMHLKTGSTEPREDTGGPGASTGIGPHEPMKACSFHARKTAGNCSSWAFACRTTTPHSNVELSRSFSGSSLICSCSGHTLNLEDSKNDIPRLCSR